MSNLLTFRDYGTKDEADDVASKFEAHNIPVKVETERALLDSVIVGKDFHNKYKVQIPAADFERAQKILIDETQVDINSVAKDYMLLSFTNDELLDVVAKPDEWGEYNYNLAKALLLQRGVTVSEHQEQALKQKYVAQISEQRSLDGGWMLLGYIFPILAMVACVLNNRVIIGLIFSFYALPGILGIILGLVVTTTKKTLPDGAQILSFNKKTRTHGYVMITLGVVAILFVFAWRYMLAANNL